MTAWACVLCGSPERAKIKIKPHDRSLCGVCAARLYLEKRRRCRTCNTLQPLDAFSQWHPITCRACRRAEKQRWNDRHREQKRAADRAYAQRRRADDPDGDRMRRRDWHRRHPGVRQAQYRRYVERHQDAHRTRLRAYRERHRERLRERWLTYYEQRGRELHRQRRAARLLAILRGER